jgi:hypothetical protein
MQPNRAFSTSALSGCRFERLPAPYLALLRTPIGEILSSRLPEHPKG